MEGGFTPFRITLFNALLLILSGCVTGANDDFRFSAAKLSSDAWSPSKIPDFRDFPVRENFDGAPAVLSSEKMASFRDFQSDFEAAIADGPDFAGHFKIVLLGCGTGCQRVFVVNVISSDIAEAPFQTSVGAEYQGDSALLIANPVSVVSAVYGDEKPDWIRTTYYVWSAGEFVPVFESY